MTGSMGVLGRLPVESIGGFGGIFFFCTFAFISMTKFTGSWNPTENYLSQLGNSDLNPNGAIYFTIAMVLGGLMMFVFYAGLRQRYSGLKADGYLSLALSCGFVNAFSVMMSGTFSETVNYDLHVLWSAIIFLTFVPILVLMNKSLGSVPDYGRFIHHYASFVVAVDLIFLGILILGGFGEGIGAIMESLSVFTFMGWIGMFSYKTMTTSTQPRLGNRPPFFSEKRP